MAWCCATKIVPVRVADLANNPAMRSDPRLDLNNFEPQISYPRINWKFLRFLATSPAHGDAIGIRVNGSDDCPRVSI